MALKQCNNCGGQMSDKAQRCPHCGNPNEALQSALPIEEPTTKKKTILWVTIGVLALILLGGLAWWYFSTSSVRAQNAEVEITPEFIKAVHQYDELFPFSEGLAAVRKDGKYGFIDTKGEEVIPLQFFGVGGFSEGLACVYDEGYNLSFINRNGETVINAPYKLTPSAYRIAGAYADGMGFVNGVCHIFATTGPEGDWEDKYIDTKGKEVAEPANSVAVPKPEYIVFTESDSDGETRYGLKDAQGKVILDPIYSYMSKPSNGVVLVRMTEYVFFPDWSSMREAESNDEQTAINIYGYVDLKGNKTFTEDDYQKIEDFKEEQKKKKFQYQYAEQKLKEEEDRQRRLAQELESTANNETSPYKTNIPSWLQGTWQGYNGGNAYVDDDVIVISGDYLERYYSGKLKQHGNFVIENGLIRAPGFALAYSEASHEIKTAFTLYRKISNSTSTQGARRVSGAANTFRSAADVISYLSSNTFVDAKGNSLKFITVR